MKKIFVLVGVFGAFSVLTACKKDYVCSCEGTLLGIPFSGVDTTYTDMTKKDAESECNKSDASFGSDYVDCELK